MHILILNQTFYPDVTATAQHMWDLSRFLEMKGHRITALTSQHRYGSDETLGAAYEKIGRIEIHRIGGTSFGKRGTLARIVDFGSFYAAAALALQRLPQPDVTVALTTPPMITSLPALYRLFRQGRVGTRGALVYYAMDLYPDALIASDALAENGLGDRAFSAVTRQAMNASDAIIALGRDMRDRIIRRYGQRLSSKIHLVRPWADGRALFPLNRSDNALARTWDVADTFNVVYSGNLGIAHDLDTMIRAIEITANDAGMQWLFIGGGKRYQALQRRVENAQWSHVKMLPYQERETLNASLNLADVHLVSQSPAFTGIVVPSKLLGIMAVGKPAIMIGPRECECSQILQEHDAGYVVPPGDAEMLVSHLRNLRRDRALTDRLGRNARSAFDLHYESQIACAQVEAVLRDLVA